MDFSFKCVFFFNPFATEPGADASLSSVLRVNNVFPVFLTSVFAFLQMNCFILYSEASYTYFSNKVIDFDLRLFLISVFKQRFQNLFCLLNSVFIHWKDCLVRVAPPVDVNVRSSTWWSRDQSWGQCDRTVKGSPNISREPRPAATRREATKITDRPNGSGVVWIPGCHVRFWERHIGRTCGLPGFLNNRWHFKCTDSEIKTMHKEEWNCFVFQWLYNYVERNRVVPLPEKKFFQTPKKKKKNSLFI